MEKKAGKFFVVSWYVFLVAYAFSILGGLAVLAENPTKGIGVALGGVWGLWFVFKVKNLLEK